MKRRILGPRAVTEALRAHADAIAVIYVTEQAGAALRELAELAQQSRITVEARSPNELDALAKGERHQGVIAIAGELSYLTLDELLERAPENPLLVALDEITDPHNFGAIVRSAVALGAHGLITMKHRAAPVTGVVVRASAGATEHAAIARVSNLAQTLSNLVEREGYQVVGLAAEGSVPLDEVDVRGPTVLVVGSEGRGLRRLVREHCTILASIALPGPIASLNASVAAGIALYAMCNARRRSALGDSDA
jgi:23S rRNA (guanosine2251-2'-O)-methyltransferase